MMLTAHDAFYGVCQFIVRMDSCSLTNVRTLFLSAVLCQDQPRTAKGRFIFVRNSAWIASA
uniref:Uncharacterized protein n=1 Tax=Oryza sativa subsp. japonica TaxID=39947 RepID=Q6YTS1_ORYSJ|nr:hypothetical protein [Oryza sativa Japonica Group]BAD10720.1 hypothetical protein [Oryza sativa Japonica Group]